MNTAVIRVDPAFPDPAALRRAADVIRRGGLVAFPTETVYGLGANALDPASVARIFAAKGRPATNPVIVHIADAAQALTVAGEWPATAIHLAERFWPGPLTVVVPKRVDVPDLVTAGGPTVAVRCPNHPVALALIRAAGVPIAAPSANRSTELSPTRVEHVLNGLDKRIEMVLDGGPCPGGIESTVVDVTGGTVRLLRPGLITIPMLEAVCGNLASRGDQVAGMPSRSPGQMEKHYSPKTPLRLVDGNDLTSDFLRATTSGQRVGLIAFTGAMPDARSLSANPDVAASLLYARLHEMDQGAFDCILTELPPDTPEWAAIRDRLLRAAAKPAPDDRNHT